MNGDSNIMPEENQNNPNSNEDIVQAIDENTGETNSILEHSLQQQAKNGQVAEQHLETADKTYEQIKKIADKPEIQKVSIEPIPATDDEDALATTFYRMLRGKKGEKGDKGDKGDSIKGDKGDKGDVGDEPSNDRLISLIEPLIPEPIAGENGEDYILTEQDKKDIADSITVPVVEKVIEKTEVIKEVGKKDTAKEIKAKLLKEGIDYSDIKNAPDFNHIESVVRNVASKTVSLIELDDVDYSGLTQINGKYVLGSGGGSYTLPIASGSTLGGVKVGSGLSIDGSGVLSASGGGSGITLKTNGTDNGSQTILNLQAGTGIALTDNGTGQVTIENNASVGDVIGPASSVGDNVVFFDGITGKLIKDSGLTLSGTNTGDQDLSGYELLSNKSTSTSLGTSDTLYPTQNAVKTYADSLVAGLLDYRGGYDASVNTFPVAGGSGTAGAVLKGDMWVVSVAGTLGGNAVAVGDSIIANVDTPGQTAANWNTLNTNITYVPENAANKVTSISGASTDTQYPSAKLTYDQLALKVNTSAIGVTVQGYNANTTILGNTTTGTGSIVLSGSPALTTPSFTSIVVPGGTLSLPTGASATLATTANLSSYLPLSGGTLTGSLSGTSILTSGNITSGNATASENLFIANGLTFSGLRLNRNSVTKWAIFNNNAGTDFFDIYNYGTSSSSLTINPSTNAVNLAGSLSGTSLSMSGNGFFGGTSMASISNPRALIIQNPAGTDFVLGIKGGTTTGSSYGPFIQAGTNSSDISLLVRDVNNTTDYLKIRGDGVATFSSSVTATNLSLSGRGTGFIYGMPDWRIYNDSSNQLIINNYTVDALTFSSSGNATFSNPLSVGTSNSITAGTLELGHASDTTISRVSAGVIAVEGVTVPSISSTSTITNKRNQPRVVSAASYTTDTGTSLDFATCDLFIVTAQAGALKFNNPSGSPVQGEKMIIRIKDNGTARALTYDTQYRAIGVTLPTTTVISKTLYIAGFWNATDTKFDVTAVGQEA